MSKRIVSYEEKCAIMEEYYKNNNEKIKNSTVFKGYHLGIWQSNLRASDRRGQLHIADSLRKRFEKIGVIAPRERRKPISTNYKYELLLKFRRNHPNERINYKTVDENGEPIGKYRDEFQGEYGAGLLRLSKEQIQELKNKRLLNKSTKEIELAAQKYNITVIQVRKIQKYFGDLDKFMKDYKNGDISLSQEQMEELGIKDFNITALSSKPISVRQKSAIIKMVLSAQGVAENEVLNNKGKFINIDYAYELLKRLPERDRNIVELYYGIGKSKQADRKTITKELHVARETINKKIAEIKEYIRQNYPSLKTKAELHNEKAQLYDNISQERKSAQEELDRLILDYEIILRNEYNVITNKYNQGLGDETLLSQCTYLSTRARNALIKAGISTIGQARSLTLEQVATLPNSGEKTFLELTEKLELQLKDKIEMLQQVLEEIGRKKQALQLKVAGITGEQKLETDRMNNINNVIEEYDSAFEKFVAGENIFDYDEEIPPTGDDHIKFFDIKMPQTSSIHSGKEGKTPLEKKKERKNKSYKEYAELNRALAEQMDKEKMLEDILQKYGIIIKEKGE